MKVNMPLVTLLSGAALGVGVLIASIVSTPSTASASSASATSPPAPAFTVTAPPPASSASGTAPATAPAVTPTTAPAAATTSAPAVTPTTAPAAATTSAPAVTPTTPAAAASSSKSAPPQADYVAQVSGGGAAVAISVHQGKAVAYVCNGHAVAAWYHGTATNGKLDLTGKDGAHLSVDYGSSHATGSLTADGMHYSFSAPMVHGVVPTGQRRPGLYEATATVHGVTIKAGWIVLPDGSQVGSVEYFADSAIPPTAQAPLLNLTTGTAQYDGVTLVASLISGLTGSGF